MKFSDTRLDQLVRFDPRVLEPPYAPYYDAYERHVFRIDHFRMQDDSDEGLWLICITNPDIIVDGYIDPEILVLVN